jgi:hypothetical protein
VGVGGADGDAEAGGELRESVVPAQVHPTGQSTLVRRELAAAVTLAGDDERGDPLDQGMRQVECGRTGALSVTDACFVTGSVATLKDLTDHLGRHQPRTRRLAHEGATPS